jgi:hypothetical protein
VTAPTQPGLTPSSGRRPAPRIILRAGQRITRGPLEVTHEGIRYADPRPDDWDADGILWARVIGEETGRPLFPTMHPLRQRAAMEDPTRLLCQVGMGPATATADGVLWLVPRPAGTTRDPHRPGWPAGRTAEPPVCAAHAIEAVRWCPPLRSRGYAAVLVAQAELVAVEGTSFRPVGGRRVTRHEHTLHELDPADGAETVDPRFLLAEHLVRDLRGITPVGLDGSLFRDPVPCDARP